MMKANTPYLCGGTVFTLLLQARKMRMKARNRAKGGADEFKDTDIMNKLIEVVVGQFQEYRGSTIIKSTSQFKSCQDYGKACIPFKEEVTIQCFHNNFIRKEPELFRRMAKFINDNLRSERYEWLVKALLEVISCDVEIDSDTMFQLSDEIFLKKEELDSVSKVDLTYFLLSVLDYVLTERRDNTKGRATFEEWHIHTGSHSPWEFNAKIGNSITKPIAVTFSRDFMNLIEGEIPEQTGTNVPVDVAVMTDNSNIHTEDGESTTPIRVVSPSSAEFTEENAQDNGSVVFDPNDKRVFSRFWDRVEPILMYCMEHDPSASGVDILLVDKINDLYQISQYDILKIKDLSLRSLIQEVVQVLLDYTYYLSWDFLRPCSNPDLLWIRRETPEEQRKFEEEFCPGTYQKRIEMRDLFLRVYQMDNLGNLLQK